jgi:hypothetical protein
MLETGTYPKHLKDRIRNGHGHLSNKQALQLFLNHRSPLMSHLILSHLSANNNKPEIVNDLFRRVAGETEIIIAPRKKETALYPVHGSLTIHKSRTSPTEKHKIQLSLFEETPVPSWRG